MSGKDDGNKNNPSAETLTAQALGRVDSTTKALVPPLHLSTTYERDADGGYSSGRGYTRPHNPTYDEPEKLLAALEGGADCLLFSSGMAAATAVFQSLLPGDHVVASKVMYWALRSWLIDFAMSWGLDVEFVDTGDLQALKAAMRPGKTRLVWIETPANPTWEITNIAAATDIAHAARAVVAVDNTVATPVLSRPLELGADLVMHSATKYLNGHSDVLAGALVCKTPNSFWQRIKAWRRDSGAVLGPFEAWLLLRGMRTLFVRVRQACASAMTLARYLQGHPAVSHVLYPGLPGFPGHDIAAAQMTGGFSGMMSIRLKSGEAGAMKAAAQVRLFKRATSLGGVESLIEHRASIEGPSTPVPKDLLRLSIGLEQVEDLIADLDQALTKALDLAAEAGGLDEVSGKEDPGREGDSTATTIKTILRDKISPMLADRGGDVIFDGFDKGVLRLRLAGSPGAAVPVAGKISALIRHYVPLVTDVKLSTAPTNDAAGGTLDAQIQQVLDDLINPAVAAHGGAVALAKVQEGVAFITFSGGCQGCAMANVTLRQGVEVLIKEQVPGVVAVEDLTAHDEGANPHFKTQKGPA